MIPGLILSKQSNIQNSIHETFQSITGILNSYANSASVNPVESTHQIRKKLKLFRAFAKLLKGCSDQDSYVAVNTFLRDLGREFSELRDAHVRNAQLQELIIQQAYPGFQELMKELINLNSFDVKQIENELLVNNNRFLWFSNQLNTNESLVRYFSGLDLSDEKILVSFSDTFEKSRLAFQSGFIIPDSEQMHEWRKRMKDVQYQTELLAGDENAAAISFYHTVVLLCDYLGEMNDLHMLASWALQQNNDLKHADKLDEWINETKYRNNELQHEAENLGNEFYHLSATDIIDEMRSTINA